MFCERLCFEFFSLPVSLRISKNSKKGSSFGKKTDLVVNATLLQFIRHLVQNLYLNMQYKLVLFEKC